MAEADENVLHNDAVDEEVKADGKQDIESQIQLAMRSRVSHFKEQADSLTFESVRRIMEKDLGLETYALDVHKRFIKACLSECLDNDDKDDGPKSVEETVEINMDTTEEKVSDLPNKKLTKKVVKDANSDNEDKMEDSPVMGLLTGDEKTKTKDSGKNCNKGIPSEKMIEVAINKRASYFRANSDDITMGGARKQLEEDLELEANSLLPFKKFIAEKIDHVLSAPASADSKVKPKSKTEEKISNRKVSKNVNREETSDYSDGEIGKNKKPLVSRKIKKTVESKKRKKGSKEIEELSGKKKKKEAQSSEGNSGKTNDGSASEDNDSASPATKPTKMKKETEVPAYGKHVENLKSIIKSCGMGVSPAVYRRVKQIPENKREAALINELKDILSKEGLSSDPSEKEIKHVRKKKQRLKELEGIDMSNIVSSTRRRSSSSFPPPPPVPKLPVESDSDGEKEDEEDSEDDDKDGEGEADHENDTDVDHKDEASDEEEEEEDDDSD